MKRIEFLAPVSAMRGNLSGTQKGLKYDPSAEYFNRSAGAYPAQNYNAVYIGNKRIGSGNTYFSTRRRSTMGVSDKTKKAAAAFGAAAAAYAAIITDSDHLATLAQCFKYECVTAGTYDYTTARGYFMAVASKAFLTGESNFVLYSDADTDIEISNPYKQGDGETWFSADSRYTSYLA